MAEKRHDTYPNPTVAEALCELHFSLPPGKQWVEAWFGDFYRAIQEDYPGMEPRQDFSWGSMVSSGGIRQGFKAGFRMVFKHKERPHLIQLASSVVTVNELASYPGWQVFKKDIQRAWLAARQVTDAVGVKRIGLRYINRIPRKNPGERVSSWLKDSPYYPRFVLEQEKRFFSRMECALEEEERMIVILGETEEENGGRPIIFDIDTISEKALPSDWGRLEQKLESLHDHVWEAFSSGVTPRLENFLKGGDDA